MSKKRTPARSGREMLLEVLLSPNDPTEGIQTTSPPRAPAAQRPKAQLNHKTPKPAPNRKSPSSRKAPAAHVRPPARSKSPSIRLVAIDLDGTLLNDSKKVAEHTAEALRCLPSKGVRVVIASARPPRSVRPIYSLLGLDTLTINYNGALIWDETARKVVRHHPMEGPLVRRIIEEARAQFEQVLVSCEVLDRWYTDRKELAYTTETGRMFKPDVVAPLDTFCDQAITKLMLLGDAKIISRLIRILPPAFPDDVAIIRCDPELIQIMDKRAGKAGALRFVADRYGVPMENVLALGDNDNDMDMLEAAGVGVAMDNAPDRVKAVADWVAPSNNDHGVHAALKRYGLCS